jgi:hypothetical protein
MERLVMVLAYFLDFAGPDAARAGMNPDMRTVRTDRPDRLQIRFRYFLGFVVRVTDLVAAEFAFPADLTRTRHDYILHRAKDK